MGPAIASGRADYMGSISPGKLADLTILEGDIYGLPSQEIPGIVIAGTMVDGKFMYRNW
jgi:predicted amidohydrolase YtcJ